MWWLERPVPLAGGGVGLARLGFRPGLRVGTPEPGETPRKLETLDLFEPSTDGGWAPVAFAALDPVAASELIRSALALAGRGAHPTLADREPDEGAGMTVQ